VLGTAGVAAEGVCALRQGKSQDKKAAGQRKKERSCEVCGKIIFRTISGRSV
jgi:hypothetical protein